VVTAPTIRARKQPAKRAFTGLAGSALSTVTVVPAQAAPSRMTIKQIQKLVGKEKSDHTLRIPKGYHNKKPLAFEAWIDNFGYKHGAIDLDNCFQEYAFDHGLGGGADPNVDSDRPGKNVNEGDVNSPTQDLGLLPGTKIITGLLEGDRVRRRRRKTEKTWWIFDGKLLRDFLYTLYDPGDMYKAQKGIFTLYYYYLQNWTDAEIWEERSFFRDVRSVKEYRRGIVNKGAEMFKDQKPESTWHGRRPQRRGHVRCDDPLCDQCSKNDTSYDYTD
jgi:hypothetical protein